MAAPFLGFFSLSRYCFSPTAPLPVHKLGVSQELCHTHNNWMWIQPRLRIRGHISGSFPGVLKYCKETRKVFFSLQLITDCKAWIFSLVLQAKQGLGLKKYGLLDTVWGHNFSCNSEHENFFLLDCYIFYFITWITMISCCAWAESTNSAIYCFLQQSDTVPCGRKIS